MSRLNPGYSQEHRFRHCCSGISKANRHVVALTFLDAGVNTEEQAHNPIETRGGLGNIE